MLHFGYNNITIRTSQITLSEIAWEKYEQVHTSDRTRNEAFAFILLKCKMTVKWSWNYKGIVFLRISFRWFEPHSSKNIELFIQLNKTFMLQRHDLSFVAIVRSSLLCSSKLRGKGNLATVPWMYIHHDFNQK